MTHVVVVGGGIAGLAAAHALTRNELGPDVTVLEASGQTGGKLRASEVAGVRVDEGAEALLARVPEGVGLLRELGLGHEIVHPATTSAGVFSRGEVRPLPVGTVMGVPADLDALEQSGVLSAAALARVSLDVLLPRTAIGDDVSVGEYVGARLGREVVDRLVDPLLGGVYAGQADDLSLKATLPQLEPHARQHRSLLAAARAVRRAAPASSGPVFASVPGGLGRVAELLTERVRADGGQVRTGVTARRLERDAAGGWRVVTGPTVDEETLHADAVVLATPAAATARLLAGVAPGAAEELAAIPYASMAVVTLAFPAGSVTLPDVSGWLVPAVEHRLVKAVTLIGRKWPGVQAGSQVELIRCSVGRAGDVTDLQRADMELVDGCVADLADMLGQALEHPVDARVSRWGGGLPQYAVGHRARVTAVKAAVAALPGLAVCGAAYDGIGVPACLRSGYAAAEAVRSAVGD